MQISDPHILIKKAARTLELLDGDTLVKTYKISLGSAPVGDKEVEGDGRTPEGEFYAFVRNDKSKYTASLGVSYPNIEDGERGLADGLITQAEVDEIRAAIESKAKPLQKTKLGGEIYIHGGGGDGDWTDGCIGLADDEILELFAAVPLGVRITILA